VRDYLDDFRTADLDAIRKLLADNDQRLSLPKKGFLRFREPYETVLDLRAHFTDFSSDVVRIGKRDELSNEDHRRVYETLRAFMPWRKGPFEVFGIEIDAEWRSERKWRRVLPHLPELAGKVVADIGSNNGYYMFRMAHYQPRCVIGFEPMIQHYYAFQTLKHLAGAANLHTELLGVEQVGLFAECFDVVFAMGILYHRISPIEALREIRQAMRPGGVLIVESQAIPGEEPVALFPESRYAKAPGTYFVPTASCLRNWMIRAGFAEIEVFDAHPMSSEEQRRTDWMTFESYADFIDPDDPSRTIEGYPAPLRVFLKGMHGG